MGTINTYTLDVESVQQIHSVICVFSYSEQNIQVIDSKFVLHPEET